VTTGSILKVRIGSEAIPLNLASYLIADFVFGSHGKLDYECQWNGGLRAIEDIGWKGQKEFVAAPFIEFTFNGKPQGEKDVRAINS